MKTSIIIILAIGMSLILGACSPFPDLPTPTITPIPTNTFTPTNAPAPTPTPTITDVKISQPIDGERIDQTAPIRGISRNVPSGSVIWIVIYLPSVRRYYPQNLPADIQVNGDWSSIVSIGKEGESGLQADVMVVLADKSTQDSFSVYLQDAIGKNDYPGLEKLPAGVLIYHRISVIRK